MNASQHTTNDQYLSSAIMTAPTLMVALKQETKNVTICLPNKLKAKTRNVKAKNRPRFDKYCEIFLKALQASDLSFKPLQFDRKRGWEKV